MSMPADHDQWNEHCGCDACDPTTKALRAQLSESLDQLERIWRVMEQESFEPEDLGLEEVAEILKKHGRVTR